ncbi:GMC family oxidoreductase [Thiobacillus denitrificans]|uniref:GMC family oxidoreductase n=1 Tax=Thiobacillus denitrificans TaxID=36861 RepID=UPI0003A9C038|nr:GMC family oxidoreductase [Thiobacillus denitrificans]
MSDQNHDVVIIGAGAGGAAAAWAFASKGIRVLVLEAGPAFNPLTDYKLNEATWELSRFPEEKVRHKAVYGFGEMQPLESRWDTLRSWNRVQGRLNATNRRHGWKYHHVRGVGGSTLHFTGEAHRLNPQAMKMYTRFDVAADWPLDYSELEPYYEIAEHIVGVAGSRANSLVSRRADFPLPAHPLSYASQVLASSGEKLGLHWEPNARAALSRPYDGRPACNYCANCNRGCPRMDKGSVDVTFMRKALETGKCTLLTNAPVQRINAGSHGRIHSVEYTQGDVRHKINTRVLVMACGAVETPRLLLHSRNKFAPEGLANENGLVGRHFMETVAWHSSGLHPDNLGSFRGLPADVICWSHNAPDAIPGVIGGCRFASGVAEADLVGPVNYARRVVSGWGRSHKQAMRQDFGRVLSVGAIGESLPNERSFVDLDPELSDEFGNPAARIHSFLPESELRRMAFMATTCRNILQATGAEELVEEYGTHDFFSATHVFGTCRMGHDARNSVVDATGRAHGWKNLYVADASVFPSSGGGESPSLTIEALALRTADHIRAAFAQRDL